MTVYDLIEELSLDLNITLARVRDGIVSESQLIKIIGIADSINKISNEALYEMRNSK